MKPTLPTNFKDDILNTSVEGMRRYQMIYNSDNTVSFKDVTPYDQTGSDFGAGDINLTNQAVNQSADAGKIIDDPDTAAATTKEGYIAGVQLFNHVNDSLQNGLIKYKIFEFDTTFASNSSNVLYDYSNDEDLKDAEIISVSLLFIGLHSSITWVNIGANHITKNIFLAVGTGQRISGTYSVLYK